MAKTYLATKTEVQLVSDDIATINTQINTPTTGFDARVQAAEAYDTRITQSESDIDALVVQVNDPTIGILKQLVDVDTELNEATTGVKARITDLEQGGTSTTKFRTHSPSGVYQDGEVVQRNDIIYKANSAIDGSSTPVPFNVGLGINMWTALDKKDLSSYVAFQDSDAGALTTMQGNDGSLLVQSYSMTAQGNRIDWTFNPDRCRVSYTHTGTQSGMVNDDILRLGDVNGAAATVIRSNLTSNRVLISSPSGKVAASEITLEELNTLDDQIANIKIALSGKKSSFPLGLGVVTYGTVTAAGVKDSGNTFTVSKLGTGHYRITGTASAGLIGSVYLESLTDDDNVHIVYSRTTTGFYVKWFDIPNMTAQDVAFRFHVTSIY